ncbi:unnamed protein product, partial [Closterium sp. Naga37s-1]
DERGEPVPRHSVLPGDADHRDAAVRAHARGAAVRAAARPHQAPRAARHQQRLGQHHHRRLLPHGGGGRGEPPPSGRAGGVRGEPPELPGHLHAVPAAAAVQVHQQDEQLPHPHRGVEHVPHRPRAAQAHGQAQPDGVSEEVSGAAAAGHARALFPRGHQNQGRQALRLQ